MKTVAHRSTHVERSEQQRPWEQYFPPQRMGWVRPRPRPLEGSIKQLNIESMTITRQHTFIIGAMEAGPPSQPARRIP